MHMDERDSRDPSLLPIGGTNSSTLAAYSAAPRDSIDAMARPFAELAEPVRQWQVGFLRAVGELSVRLGLTTPAVLEVGSCSGGDAANLLSQAGAEAGREIDMHCTDAVPELVEQLPRRLAALGFTVPEGNIGTLDVLAHPIPRRRFHGIIANAVVNHFTSEQLNVALANMAQGLIPQGVLALNMRQLVSGAMQEFTDDRFGSGPRFQRRYTSTDITERLEALGFTVNLRAGIPGAQGTSDPWMHVIAIKGGP